MSNILIWRRLIPGSDIDFLSSTNYREIYQTIVGIYGKNPTMNWGNKIWFQAVYSEINTPENRLTFRTDETPEEINEEYDVVVYPMANFFGEQYCTDTTGLVKDLDGVKIPIYIIAVGVQADDYNSLDKLVKKIGDPAKRFIDRIYETGGEFALRGYLTKEFFSRLGYKTAVVTGCPSLYQLGPDLHIEKDNTRPIKPIINGRIGSFEKILKEIPRSVFIAQDSFLSCLYNPNYFSERSLKKDILFISNSSIFQAELLGQDRIKLMADANEWYQYIRNTGVNYSFGTKIHGSIVPVLAGVPATVVAIDSRTREMAEFFEIPWEMFRTGYEYSPHDLYASYEQADYSLFNEHFPEKYYAFERFLKEHGIVNRINRQNVYFSKPVEDGIEPYRPNQKRFAEYAQKLKKEKLLLYFGEKVMEFKNRKNR